MNHPKSQFTVRSISDYCRGMTKRRAFGMTDMFAGDLLTFSPSNGENGECASLGKREWTGAVAAFMGIWDEAPVVGRLPWLWEAARESGLDSRSPIIHKQITSHSAARQLRRVYLTVISQEDTRTGWEPVPILVINPRESSTLKIRNSD